NYLRFCTCCRSLLLCGANPTCSNGLSESQSSLHCGYIKLNSELFGTINRHFFFSIQICLPSCQSLCLQDHLSRQTGRMQSERTKIQQKRDRRKNV
ncbi:hypothetical protein T310_9442, partial [Rasamsonia emersonii CBS 393.64]